MLFLMIGLRLLRLPLRICLSSTPLSGRECLETRSSNMSTKKNCRRMTPRLLTIGTSASRKLLKPPLPHSLSKLPQTPTLGSPRSPSIVPAQQRESSTPGQQREKTVRFVSTPSSPSQNGSPTTTSPALKWTTLTVHPSALAPRRSSRTRNAPKRLGFDGTGQGGYLVMNVDCLSCAEPVAFNAVACNDTDPFALKAARIRTLTPCHGMKPWVLPTVSSGSPQLFRKSACLRRTKRGSKFLSLTPRRRFCQALGSSAARELLMASSRSIKVIIAAAVTSKKASSTRQPTLCFGRRSLFFSFFHSPGVGLHAQLTLRVPLFRPSSKIRFGFMCRVVFVRLCLEKPASASAKVCTASESLLACGRNICRRPFASWGSNPVLLTLASSSKTV